MLSREDRVIRWAEMLESGQGFRVADPTCTVADLTTVSRWIRGDAAEAADLAGVRITCEKVGDEARIAPVPVRELIRQGVVCGTCADEGERECSCWEVAAHGGAR